LVYLEFLFEVGDDVEFLDDYFCVLVVGEVDY